jgi:hypothetical protein
MQPDDESDCAGCAIVSCEFTAALHTHAGYWFNHRKAQWSCATLKAAIETDGGKLDLVSSACRQNGSGEAAPAEAMLYFPPSGTGSTLCGARNKLAFHLIAAIANSALFGTDPGNCQGSGGFLPSDLIHQAQLAGACDDLQEIKRVTALLGQFENSGDNADFPPGLKACPVRVRRSLMR